MTERIHHDLSELIGNTPLLALHRIEAKRGLRSRLLAKIEYLSPAGSIKDRAALGIILDGEKSGRLKPGDLLVDVTSGNTGIGFAAVAASRGYRTKFYLRNIISQEKLAILAHYGAEVVLIDSSEFVGPGAVDAILDRIRRENPDAFFTDQRGNPANPRIHEETTGPEIWRDTDGAVDVLVGAVGTGGTISGAGRFLKSKKPGLKVVVAEPTPDALPSAACPYAENIEGVHKVTEIPPGDLPGNFHPQIVDEVVAVNVTEAKAAALSLARDEGILAGTSGGAALFAALALSARPDYADKSIVIVIPDSGERYLSPATRVGLARHC
jgi:cysteine synthase A